MACMIFSQYIISIKFLPTLNTALQICIQFELFVAILEFVKNTISHLFSSVNLNEVLFEHFQESVKFR